MNLTFHAILFDIDGTLVDNMMVHHRAWQRKLKELGLDYSLQRVKEEIHGVNLEILERLFGDRFSHEERVRIAWEKEEAYREIFAAEFMENVVPGTLDFIERAAELGIPMAVATAGPKENAEFVVDTLHLRPRLGHIVHSGMVQRGKPDPEVFQQAADGLNVQLSDCLIFEDSVTGAQAANNAGCPVVVLTTTHEPTEFTNIKVANFRPNFTGLQLSKAKHGFLLTD